ncbi:uncharacterized protein LOC113272289 [Papaver somniferum]|uniref:uncharacterized protein LOC113272289 n=1 Tax=Papaver somniferum TaxID=3469 RepID=UPI000E705D08|nr:uncharacterized protein LOC113272289 [Papaver somniferum]
MAGEVHNRALFVTSSIKNSEFRRVLIDTGASTNLVTMKTLKEAKVPQSKIVHHPILMTGFEGIQSHTYGYVYVDLKVGPIQSTVKFHVIDKDHDYHMILGRPWLHDNKVFPSTYHQCIKALVNNKIVRIPASVSPYALVYDAKFLESPKSIPQPPCKICSTPLPNWKSVEKADKSSSTDAKSSKLSIKLLKRRQGKGTNHKESNFITDYDA